MSAKRIEKRRLQGRGLETLVDLAAVLVLALGLIGAVSLLATMSWWGVVASGGAVFAAAMNWLLLRCLAEHLRLQKKIAGCEFAGKITGQREETVWACGHCGHILHTENRCESCGKTMTPEDD